LILIKHMKTETKIKQQQQQKINIKKKEHYKSDWHLFNIKQKLKGKPIVGSNEFEELTGNLLNTERLQ
jgi:hypothetical protein